MMPTGFEAEAFGFVKDVITAGITGGTGDVIAQFAEKQKQDKENNSDDDGVSFFSTDSSDNNEPFELDIRRSLSYATFAAGYTGAFQHVLFANMQEAIADPVMKLAINQGLIIPLCYYTLLVWLVPKLRAKSQDEEDMLRGSINVLKMIPRNWAFWVPLQFIQFNFIPTEFQVIYCSCLGLIWNVCLSFLTAGKVTTEPPPLPETAMVKSDVRITVASSNSDATRPVGLVPILQSADRTTSSPSFSNDSSEGRGDAKWLRILNGSEDEDAETAMAEGEEMDMDVTTTQQPFLDTVFRRRR